jgi:hypothetical protein
MIFSYFAIVKFTDLRVEPEWTLKAIEAQTEPLDLEAVKMSDQKNISVAIEFEYPFGAARGEENANTEAHYNEMVHNLSKFLYIEQHSYSLKGFDLRDASTNKTIDL